MVEVSFERELDKLAQIIAEDTYSKKNIHKEIKTDIVDGFKDIEAMFKNCCNAVVRYLNGDYYASKNKRIEYIKYINPQEIVLELFIVIMPCNNPTSIQKVVGALAPWFEYDDPFDGARTAAEIIGSCVNTRLYTIIEARNSEDGYINVQSQWLLEQQTLDFIEKSRYLNPMISMPEAWTSNKNGGYITSKNSVILGKNKHHDEKQALDVLNQLQDIKWSLDKRILALGEVSKKPLDTRDKIKSFTQLKRISETVYQEMIDQGNVFYFSWRMDFRGRIYSDGYYVNFQSNDFRKAMLEFTEKQLIEG